MTITLNGSTGINTPGVVNTAAETIATTLAVTGVTTIAAGSAAAPALVGTTGGATTGIFFPAASTIAFANAGVESARIDSSGNLLVGAASVPSGGQKMNIAGGITPTTDNSFIFGNSGLRWQALYAANGTIQTSDERQKTDIVDSPLGLNFVMTLRPVAYKFKVGKNVVGKDADGNDVVTPVPGKRQHFGLLSQQVKQAVGDVDFGGWIHTDPSDPESDQGLRYDEFVAPLIKAIQEQQDLITSLTARITALENK